MLDVTPGPDAVVVSLARPPVNALDVPLLQALTATFTELAGERRPVVLTGAGRAFSAGVDLHAVVDGGPTYAAALVEALHQAFVAVLAHPAPVVAAIGGHALAGGFVLAAACDVRLAAAGAHQLGVPELAVGVPFPTAAIEVVRWALGTAGAARLALTGERIGVDEARRLGFLSDVVDGARLAEVAAQCAAGLGALPGPAYALAKAQLQRPVLARIAAGRAEDEAEVVRLWASPATRAAVGRYLEGLRG